ESTNRALERRLLIERQIADTQAIPVPTLAPNGDSASLGTTEQQLDLARARLTLLLQHYTPNHPEVVMLKRTISDLTDKLEEESPADGRDGADTTTAISPAEAAQRKRILDLKAERDVIEHQLASNRAEEQRLKQTVGSYQSKVDMLPTRESELVELTRDYG